jgi:hypothetical protein
MALDDELFALEEKLWPGDAQFYRAHLDERCIVSFTEMAGIMEKEQIAGMIKAGQRWRDLKLKRQGFYQPTADTAIITYEVTATRDTGAPHHAHVSTVYVRRGDGWKMAFHQQSRFPAEPPSPRERLWLRLARPTCRANHPLHPRRRPAS